MASDLFCRWAEGRVPSAQDVYALLRDYLGDLGALKRERKGDLIWFVVYLPGKPSNPFRALDPALSVHRAPARAERGFEVVYSAECLDVITRQADHLTNAVAEAFARLACRYWGARWDDGGHTNLDGSPYAYKENQ